MRLDEYGRWVSDDGAYIWDETAQVWQPATVSLPLPPPPSPLGGGPGEVPGTASGQTDWQSPAGSGSGSASGWPDASWGATGEYSLPSTGQATGADPASTWSPAQPADHANSGAYRLDTGALGTGAWPVPPADPLNSGAYPLDTGALDTSGINAGGLGTGGWPVQSADPLDSGAYPLDTGGLDTGGFGASGWQAQPGADPLTDTGASAWDATSGTGSHALWQPAAGDGASAWSAAAPGTTESVSPSTGATPLWGADPSTGTGGFPLAAGTAGAVAEGYGPASGYAPTGAYPGGEWAAGGLAGEGDDLDDSGGLDDGLDDDDRHGFTPSGSTSAVGGRRVPRGRRPFGDDGDDFHDDLDEPRGGRFAALTRSRLALLGVGLVAVTLLGFLTFVLLGGDDGNAPQATTDATGRYDEAFRRSYLDTCIQASNTNAADYCSCTLDKFEADYSQDEFVRLSTDPNGAESREAVRLVTESCRAGQ